MSNTLQDRLDLMIDVVIERQGDTVLTEAIDGLHKGQFLLWAADGSRLIRICRRAALPASLARREGADKMILLPVPNRRFLVPNGSVVCVWIDLPSGVWVRWFTEPTVRVAETQEPEK